MRLRVGGRNDDLLTRINAELVAMEQEAASQAETRSMWSVLTDKTLLLPIILVCALLGGQQLSGINAVFYYSVEIFKKIGLSETNAKYANLGAGVVNLMVAFTGKYRLFIYFLYFFQMLNLFIFVINKKICRTQSDGENQSSSNHHSFVFV